MPSIEMDQAFRRFRTLRAARGEAPPALATLRASFAPGGKPFPMPSDVRVERAVDGPWSADWLLAPGVRRERTVLALHGGGFTIGDLRSHGELAARIGKAADARVLFLSYRLAPEHRCPAAFEDTLAAWQWLRTHEQLDASSIAVVGDSAGGNLALLLLSRLRDMGEALPSAAAVMSPQTDHACSGSSMTERAARDPIFTAEMIERTSASYLDGKDARSPEVSPLYAPLDGLPPLLVQVGTEELLYSDSERLVERARAAGVEVTFEVGEGLLHVFQSVADAPEARAATDRIGAFLQRAWSTKR